MDKNNVRLNNGIEIPIIGTGPCFINYAKCKAESKIAKIIFKIYMRAIGRKIAQNKWIDTVAYSFRNGYSLLDNSSSYHNWNETMKAIKKSGVKRESLFITTRVGNKAQFGGEEAIRKELDDTLKLLHTNYIDLLQFHWPVTNCYLQTWEVMEKIYKEGKCRAIGVANCNIHHLEAILNNCTVKPTINQIEVHPLFTQKQLLKYCQEHEIVVEAYTPIARFDDRLMRLPSLNAIADKYKKSPVQVILRWHIQNGCIPIIRSSNKKRIKQNIDIFDFELTKDDMSTIDGFNINSRLRYDPDNCDFTIL